MRLTRLLTSALIVAVLGPLASARANVPDTADQAAPQTQEGWIRTGPDMFDPVLVAGPFEFPWSFGFLPDGGIVLTERPGRLRLLRESGVRRVFGLRRALGADIVELLDVAIDRDFANNRVLYLSYAYGTDTRSTLRVARVRLDTARARVKKGEVIFESFPARVAQSYGGRIALSHDGHLFLALGDRWEKERAQNPGDLAGSVIRIRTDGSVPRDNPFVDLAGARPEIWSFGHRNALGLAFDEVSGHLWSHENGPLGGDEVNRIERGQNYGWPVVTHGLDYSGKPMGEGREKEGMQSPVHVFAETVAPSGLAVERQGEATVLWLGALAGQALIRLEIHRGEVRQQERFLHEELGRIRDVRRGPDGLLYVITDDPEGALYRLAPVAEPTARRTKGRRL